MRQVVAVMLLVALFAVLVGSRFRASDGEKLAAVSRLSVSKVRNAMPPTLNVIAPVDALRKELPTRPEDAVRARLASDKRFAGLDIKVTADGGAVTLRGVVPGRMKPLAVEAAQNTVGVESVVDELAVPAE